MGDGPTSSRVAVVDFNFDSQRLVEPVAWDGNVGWFREPAAAHAWLPVLPENPKVITGSLLNRLSENPYYHQVNVWAVVQRVLEFYEEPWALGRPVPWGFDGNRLIVVPHAGYGENAFYDAQQIAAILLFW